MRLQSELRVRVFHVCLQWNVSVQSPEGPDSQAAAGNSSGFMHTKYSDTVTVHLYSRGFDCQAQMTLIVSSPLLFSRSPYKLISAIIRRPPSVKTCSSKRTFDPLGFVFLILRHHLKNLPAHFLLLERSRFILSENIFCKGFAENAFLNVTPVIVMTDLCTVK